jgi:hypothetical protein
MCSSVAAILVFIIMSIAGFRDVAAKNDYLQNSLLRNRTFPRIAVASRRLDGDCEVVEFSPIWDASEVATAQEKCKQCVLIEGNGNRKCKWCPLTQTCQPARKSAGKVKDCVALPSQHSDDAEVTTEDQCQQRPASWINWMDSLYGANWSEKKETHMDVIRCSQWALDWPIHVTEKDMKEDVKPVKVGEWGCISGLLRAALIRLFGGGSFAIDESKTLNDPVEDWEATTVTPKICEIYSLKENKDCKVDLLGESDFAMLRTKATSCNTFGPADYTETLLESVKSGPLITFDPGAGKSGSGFCRAFDDKMKVKRGVKKTWGRIDEPGNLRHLVLGTETAPPMHEHFKRNPNSLMNRYFGFVRTSMFNLASWTLIMQDASYDQDARVQALRKTTSALTYTRYDLKGKSRDPDEMQKPDKQFTLLNGDFKENEDNKLKLSSRQCWRLRKAVRLDAQYLHEHDMIDYSLFVGVASGSEAPDCRGTPKEPFCFQGKGNGNKYQYTVSLLDYLNEYNAFKTAEGFNPWRWKKFANYSGKMAEFIESICYSNEKFEESWDTMVIMLWVGGSIVGLMIILGMLFYWKPCKAAPAPAPSSQIGQELTSNFLQAGSQAPEYGSQLSGGFQCQPPAWGVPSSMQQHPTWGMAGQTTSWGSGEQLSANTRTQQVTHQAPAISAAISSAGPPPPTWQNSPFQSGPAW